MIAKTLLASPDQGFLRPRPVLELLRGWGGWTPSSLERPLISGNFQPPRCVAL